MASRARRTTLTTYCYTKVIAFKKDSKTAPKSQDFQGISRSNARIRGFAHSQRTQKIGNCKVSFCSQNGPHPISGHERGGYLREITHIETVSMIYVCIPCVLWKMIRIIK